MFWHCVGSMALIIKAVLKAKGVQHSASKVYLMKWQVNVDIERHSWAKKTPWYLCLEAYI